MFPKIVCLAALKAKTKIKNSENGFLIIVKETKTC